MRRPTDTAERAVRNRAELGRAECWGCVPSVRTCSRWRWYPSVRTCSRWGWYRLYGPVPGGGVTVCTDLFPVAVLLSVRTCSRWRRHCLYGPVLGGGGTVCTDLFQVTVVPQPSGVTRPIPVTTTRRAAALRFTIGTAAICWTPPETPSHICRSVSTPKHIKGVIISLDCLYQKLLLKKLLLATFHDQ